MYSAAVAAALAAMLALAGCGGDLLGAGSFTDEGADQIITADTPAERGLRACLATTVISELITYRVLFFESSAEDRRAAQSAMETMLQAVRSISGALDPSSEDPFWFETEMFYVVIGLVHGVGEPLTEHVLGTVADALTGQVRDLITTFRVRAGQLALAKYMIADIKLHFEREDRGTMAWLETGWELCESRVEANMAKLQ